MSEGRDRRVQRAARLSLAYNVILTAIKAVAAVLTGSVSLATEAAHSAVDIVASGVAFASVRAAARPPDEEHPYGHGKIESLAGFGESVMLLMIVGYAIFEAVPRLFQPAPVARLDVGMIVMGVSAVSALLVGLSIGRAGRETNSLALRSNAQHLMVDAWTSFGVLAALAANKLTGWNQADPVFAILLAAWIAFNAGRMAREAFNELIDRRLPDEEVQAIRAVLADEPELISYHRLRTRHSGHMHYVELHAVVPNDWSVVRAHELADRLEARIREALPPANVVVHVDPYDAAKVRGTDDARGGTPDLG